jgi:hypothetical protein
MKTFTKIVLLLATCTALFSFALLPGGDHYEVYLDDKRMLNEFVHAQKEVPSLNLDARTGQRISIQYSHCGVVGTARHISIKDPQNKLLKEWHFTDAAGAKSPMVCLVKDIVALRKGNASLNLYYSSKEMPNGKLLATLVLAPNQDTALN